MAATDFISDVMLKNLIVNSIKTYYADDVLKYCYESVFGRLTYNYGAKYILNGMFRRGGSFSSYLASSPATLGPVARPECFRKKNL